MTNYYFIIRIVTIILFTLFWVYYLYRQYLKDSLVHLKIECKDYPDNCDGEHTECMKIDCPWDE